MKAEYNNAEEYFADALCKSDYDMLIDYANQRVIEELENIIKDPRSERLAYYDMKYVSIVEVFEVENRIKELKTK